MLAIGRLASNEIAALDRALRFALEIRS